MKKLWHEHKIAVIISCIITALVAGGIAAAIFINPTITPPPITKKKETTQFLASKDFTKMPLEQQKEYLQSLAKGGSNYRRYREASPKERQQIWKNTRAARNAIRKEHLNNFFKMSKEEQNKELDKLIARFKTRRAQRQAQRQAQQQRNSNSASTSRSTSASTSRSNSASTSSSSGGARQQRSRNFATRMKQRYEETDPQTRAQRIEYFKALRDRMSGKR